MALKPDGNASVASQVFAAWAANLNLSSSEVGCPSSGASGEDWEMCYNMSKSSKSLQLALSNPSLFYHFTKFQHDYGLRAWGAATKIIKDNMPDASVGANFSPGKHSGCLCLCLGVASFSTPSQLGIQSCISTALPSAHSS